MNFVWHTNDIFVIVTIIFFRQYLTSVWCFFAAIISGGYILDPERFEKNFTQQDSSDK